MNKEFSLYSDLELSQAFKEGNKEVLSFIYRQHHKHLVNYGIRLYSKEDIIEDCIHNIFIELWNKRKTLTQVVSIRFYLLKTLRNKIYTYIKKQNSVADIDLYSDNYHFNVEYSFEERLIQEIGDQELKSKLTNALNLLSSRQKEAIYLRFYNNLDYQDIAKVMGINYQSIRTHIYQGIKLLRENLAVELTVVVMMIKFFFAA